MLNARDKDFLAKILAHLINFIASTFCIITPEQKEMFWAQLTQNNMLDLQALLQLLLPCIDDPSGDKKKNLTSLPEIYTKTNEFGEYTYTNTQYNRCIRNDNNTFTLRTFKRVHIIHNLKLLYMTIDMCASQLFVNWVDIVPMRIDNYRESELYLRSMSKFDMSALPYKLIEGYIDFVPGLSISKVYNVIINNLFHQIKNHKWLIYDISTANGIVSYAKYLETKFNFEPLWQEKHWSKLTTIEKEKFNRDWINMLSSIDRNDNIVMTTIYFFMGKYHDVTQLIRQKLFIVKKQSNDDDIGDVDSDNKLFKKQDLLPSDDTVNDMRDGFQNLPAEHAYHFFYSQIIDFKKTWYYHLHKQDKKYGGEPAVTGKIIYNYAKALSNNVINNEYTNTSKYWYSKHPGWLSRFIERFFSTNSSWFNINNYYRRLYPTIKNLVDVTKQAYDIIRSEIIGIVFECLIYKGTLSEFVPRPEITDTANTTGMSDAMINKYKYAQMERYVLTKDLRDKYNEYAYYYLTNKSYGELPLIYLKKYGKVGIDYLKYLLGDQYEWSFTYGVNWVSQINFFHRYINTRVIYVTGSTGVGKSTQVPKLILYALKMINYLDNGKIICSVPRKLPAEDNAKIISAQSGVPINQWDSKYNANMPSSNFQIQYKYQGGSHVDSSNNFLRIVTDGTLLEELKRSPFLTSSTGKKYDYHNKYDVVIVDEAHEHNTNMDIILTMMRDVAYVNNSVKLVIISATMDSDEPIYRRYYRPINDNRAYPPNYYIQTVKIDRANVDRRIHISAPGKTTQYKINDYYVSKLESDTIDATEKYVDKANEIAVKIIKETSSGNLLLIHPGQMDIITSVEFINKNSPPNVVALPYYSTMLDKYKDMVTTAAAYPGNFNIPKEEIISVLTEETTPSKQFTGYTRIFIVGTNVMEASVTVSGLKYVVDTGLSKINIYDPISNTAKLTLTPISQSSADQRRGRVGRTSSGSVYRVYHKDKLRNIKTLYSINSDDISMNIIDILQNNINDTVIFDKESDVNGIANLKRLDGIDLKKYATKFFPNSHAYDEIIYNRYASINNTSAAAYFYKYYGLNMHDDYEFQEKNPYNYSRYHSGYDATTLIDDSAQFYIIHPDENIIYRDRHIGHILKFRYSKELSGEYCNEIINVNNLHSHHTTCEKILQDASLKIFMLPKIRLILENAKIRMMVYEINNITVKTIFLQKIMELKKDLDSSYFEDSNTLLWYIYGIRYNIHDDILALITMLKLSKDGFPKILYRPPTKQSINQAKQFVKKFKSYNSYSDSDIHFFWDIWMDIKKAIEKSSLNDKISIPSNVANYFETLKNKYLTNELMDAREYSTIHTLYQKNQLGVDGDVSAYVSSINPPDIRSSELMHRINKISKKYLINNSLLELFLKIYVKDKIDINKQFWSAKYNKQYDNTENIIDWANKLYLPSYIVNPTIELSDWQKAIECYIRSHTNNIVSYSGNRYANILSGLEILPLPWSMFDNTETTLLTNKTKYIIYNNGSGGDADGLMYLTSVSIKKAMYLNPYYFFNIIYHKDKNIEYANISNEVVRNMNAIKNMFDIHYLIAYVDKLGIPEIRNNIYNEILDVIK